MGKSHKRKKNKENKSEKFFKKLKKIVDAMPDSSSDTTSSSPRREVMHTSVPTSGRAAKKTIAGNQEASTSRQGIFFCFSFVISVDRAALPYGDKFTEIVSGRTKPKKV